MAIATNTKDQEVYQQLRERILRNSFRPGERLREQELCRQLNVTRTPLRLALRRLEHERLIVGEAYRGCRVREVRSEEIEPLFDMREVLEGLAARNVALAGETKTLARLQEMALACDQAEQNEQWMQFFEHDKTFHSELIRRSNNDKLIEVIEVNNFQLRTFALHDRYLLHVVEQLRARAHELVYNHRSLAEALSSGDAEAAESKMRAHIRDARQVVMQAWAQWQTAQKRDGTTVIFP